MIIIYDLNNNTAIAGINPREVREGFGSFEIGSHGVMHNKNFYRIDWSGDYPSIVLLTQSEINSVRAALVLESARTAKIAEIKQAYTEAEESSTITINSTTYRADRDFLAEVDLEKRLAEANGETTIIVFDVDLSPHTVNISAVGAVMQQIRVNTKANFEKGKNLVRQVKLATTIDEINNIVW